MIVIMKVNLFAFNKLLNRPEVKHLHTFRILQVYVVLKIICNGLFLAVVITNYMWFAMLGATY